MSIASEINRLQTAKAGLKTAIENKGVTVPSSTKLDGYANLVDSIEAGGSAPYIVNPLNGASFGSPTQVGSITHQYQISGETLVDCGVSVMEFTGRWYSNSSVFPVKEQDVRHCKITITSSGLLTLNLTRSQSAVNEYEWLTAEPFIVTFHLSNGTILADYLYPYCNYSCFIKDTNIVLANRLSKKIQDITYDDELLVWNFDEGKYDSAKPLWIQSARRASEYKLVTLDDGKQLRLVGAGENCHRLFCVEDGAFVYANNMVGKTTVYENGVLHKVVSCEVVKDDVEYYNIITDYHMNLYADEVLTSCRYSNLYPIKDMAYVKDERSIIPIDEYKVSEEYYYGMRLGESCINPKDTIAYIANIEAFRTLR